jgi:DNA polymerase-3 subunit alpha
MQSGGPQASAGYTTLDQVDESLQGRDITIAGMVTRVRSTVTHKGEDMAFVEMEDLSSSIDVIVFPKAYKRYQAFLAEDRLLVIQGKVDMRDGKAQIISESIQDYALADVGEQVAPAQVRLIEVNLTCTGNHDADMKLLNKAYQILQRRQGADRFYFNVIMDRGRVQLDFPNATTHYEPELENLLKEALGQSAILVRWTEA